MFFDKKNNRISTTGFTLIELMVVIAIIAILATVVLVALQSARDAAYDSNKKTALAQIRSLAVVYYTQNDTYEGIEDSDEFKEIKEKEDTHYDFYSDGYCITTKLRNDKWICLDNERSLKEYENRRCAGSNTDCTKSYE